MTAQDIIQKYISFFEKRGHKRIPNAPLVPENDPTTLFTSSGMQALVPYLLGEPHPQGKRLVNVQNCFRAQDINEVGDNRHTTFFRMIGNWSLGDYFKKEQLPWFFEFLTSQKEGLGLDPNRLYITVFGGEEKFKVFRKNVYDSLKPDLEAMSLWKRLFEKKGIDAKTANINPNKPPDIKNGRIFYYGSDKNWWSRSGTPDKMPIGEPGGPDSEVFYDFGEELNLHNSSSFKNQPCHPNCQCGRFLEIGNSVFMQYKKIDDLTFEELPNKNVDFGGGLERLLATVENQNDIFQTSLFAPIIEAVERVTYKKYEENKKEMRLVADHMISAVFIVNSDVAPSNKEQGYILRRLIRRAFDNINLIRSIENMAVPVRRVIETIITKYKDTDSVLENNFEKILHAILEEINNYRFALSRAQRFIKNKYKIGDAIKGFTEISSDDAFTLYATHGLSPTQIKSLGFTFNKQEFAEKMKSHQEISRKGATQKFAGGLADHQKKTIMGHTATHLLHQAIRDVLESHVHQTGSNITTERIRFDFNYDNKLTDDEIKKIEDIVNEKIKENLKVYFEMMPLAKAKKIGAIGLFDEKYSDMVKVYSIGPTFGSAESGRPYSVEFCGGPHVDFTQQLKRFKIIKQENVGHGQRRLYCLVG